MPLLWSEIPDKLQQARPREEVSGPARSSNPHTVDAGEPERGAERRLQITLANLEAAKKALPGKNPVNANQ